MGWCFEAGSERQPIAQPFERHSVGGNGRMAEQLHPKQQVRRFDVFAEYSKLKALREGRPLDQAKGHGIWLAKVVASRRYGAPSSRQTSVRKPQGAGAEEAEAPAPFRTLGGELQTDALFDREIV